jgi:uncharacterized protein YbbK (DUF523 family)
MNLLVSACLLGVECRYCGTGLFNSAVYQLKEQHNLIPVCPEQLGGLTTPRNPVEIRDNLAIDEEENEYTTQFNKGAEEVLKIAQLLDCPVAILKSKSPSCGYGKIYDGNFDGTLIPGKGITAAKLEEHGIKVLTEQDIEDGKF